MAVWGGMAALLPRCSTPERGTAVPQGETTKATVLGLPNERFFPAYGTDPLYAEVFAAVRRQRQALGLTPDQLPPEMQILAVSGGGEDGAFGAGLLCGWTESGTRPVFELVTGVSTGALTAPFAFLGSAYDAQLRSVYTELSPDDVLESRGLIAGALFADAMADNSPLFKTISRYLTPNMQAALAKAYLEGRLLLIGTTDLDAQLPVIWNVGAIAASNHPRALDTIRRVLLASAAIPGAFPPTMFDVTLDGVAHQEMHVDGGAFTQRATGEMRRFQPFGRNQLSPSKGSAFVRSGCGINAARSTRCRSASWAPSRTRAATGSSTNSWLALPMTAISTAPES